MKNDFTCLLVTRNHPFESTNVIIVHFSYRVGGVGISLCVPYSKLVLFLSILSTGVIVHPSIIVRWEQQGGFGRL